MVYFKIHNFENPTSRSCVCSKYEITLLGKLPISIFLDLSKVFDTLDHSILLHKLKYYEVNTVPLNWFESYLEDRFQFVDYDGTKSNITSITTGVPQGSILGPLLFIIYIYKRHP